jgi:hypothetical protein
MRSVTRTGLRLSARKDPLSLAVSGSLWRGAWYLIVYVFAAGWLLFSAAFTAVAVALFAAVTLAGIPLLTAAAGVLRGCANAERLRLRPVVAEPVRGGYRKVARPGVVAQATTRWKDPATWRDLAYLIALWVPLLALDTVVLTIWLSLLCLVLLPAWYWAPESTYGNGLTVHGVQFGNFPNGPHGAHSWGIFVQTLPQSLIVAAVSLVVFLLFNYVVVGTAAAHATVARGLLRAPADPLAEARAVLASPGALSAPEPVPPASR